MRNKFINLLVQDLSLSLKIIAVALLAPLYLFLQKGVFLRELEAARWRQDKALAEQLARQIPGLQKKIEALSALLEKGKIIENLPLKINLVLSGIFIKDNKPVVLIGENIYQKNDTVEGFTISDITSTAVILEDQATKEERELRLPK